MAKSRFRQASGYSTELKKRTEQNTGGGFITIFKDSLNLPIFKEPKEGDVGINVIPYLATKNHPQAKEGAPVYKLELWIHSRVGPEKGDYVCLRNFGEDCPLCQARYDELSSSVPRKKVADDLKGTHRAIYNVEVVTNEKEEAKGVQVWMASTYLGEQNFQAAAKDRKTGDKIPFSCPDTGKTIWFTVEGSKLTKKFAGIALEPRPEPIPDEVLDQAFELENCIVIPKSEDLQKIADIIIGSGGLDEDEPPDPPSRRGRKSEYADDADQDDPPPRRRAAKEPDEQDDSPPRRRAEQDYPPPRRRAEKDEDVQDEDVQDDPPPRRRASKEPDEQDEQDDSPPRRRAEQDDPPPRRRAAKEPDDADQDDPPPRRRAAKESDDAEKPAPRRSRIRRED